MAPFPERRAGKLTGFYCVDVNRKGKRFRERFDKLVDAEGYEAFVIATGTAPPWARGKAPSGPTFREVAEACKAHGGPKGKWKRGRDPGIPQRLDYVCRIIGDVPMADVTTETFDVLVESLEDRPGRRAGAKMANQTINNYLVAASAVMTYAEARPKTYPGFVRPEVPWRTKSEHKIVWYTPEQEDAVCRVLTDMGQPVVALIVRVLASTGLRVRELLRLEPADVEDEWLRLWKTKTDKPRSVPIDPQLARELRAVIGSRIVPTYHVIYHKVVEAVGKCGYSDALNVHALRHTTATRLIRKGVPVEVVQKWLGHSSIQTTMRYAHVFDDVLLEAAKKLSPNVWGNSEHHENTDVVPLRKTK